MRRRCVGWALADAWTITGRDLAHSVLRPGPLLIGWFFPDDALGNPDYSDASWIGQQAVPMAIVLPVVITMIILPLSARAYRGLGR